MLLFAAPHCSSLLLAAPRCSSLRLAGPRCSSLLFAAPRCSSLLLAALLCRRCSSLVAASRCSSLLVAVLAAPRCSSLLFAAPRCLLLLGVLAALCCSSLLFVAPRCSSLLFGIMCLRILQPFRRDRLFYSSFGFPFIVPVSTAMDIKIQALQRAEEVALEKAQKILPRDAELPPQALRCQYRWRLLLGGDSFDLSFLFMQCHAHARAFAM